MRIAPWFLLAGCNAILGNGDFRGPGGAPDCVSRGLPPTTLSGTVFAPNGTLPIDHALVYVPTAPLADLPEGPSGPICASGSPAVTAFSDAHGTFQLSDVPAGIDVRLVIQVGKWRRAVTVPSVPACATTAVDPVLTHLPRDSTEGHIPHLAITTGNGDTLECIARDLGIADSEIGSGPTSTARVRLYASNGTKGSAMGAFEPASALLTADTVQRYDAILLGCEGTAATASAPGAQALFDFTNRGGWLWVSHVEFPWLLAGPAPWTTIGTFNTSSAVMPSSATILIDQGAPRAQDLVDWSVASGLSATPGSVTLQYIRSSCMTSDPVITHPIMRLDPTTGMTGIQMFTWDAAMGGRLVASDIHRTGPPPPPAPSPSLATYPAECVTPTGQEKAILFELFDTPTCVN
jgi:hypothetical protein